MTRAAELETMRIKVQSFTEIAVPERAEKTGFPFERERECVCPKRIELRGRPRAPGDRLIRGSRQ